MNIERLVVRGFRSFGAECAPLEFGAPLAVVWGQNSEGKTSFAEALEFLLTGDTARRALLASAKDEFAGALRNVHVGDDVQTFVEATLSSGDEKHVLRRTLTNDYGKKGGCESLLELDGNACSLDDVAELGLPLTEPPLGAPVLMQHTLGYLLSAKPSERSKYFKALLEVGDLDGLTDAMKEFEGALPAPEGDASKDLARCAELEPFEKVVELLRRGASKSEAVEAVLSAQCELILKGAGFEVPSGRMERGLALERAADEQSARTFPLSGFNLSLPGEPEQWPGLDATFWLSLEHLVEAHEGTDEETTRLLRLFTELLELPEVSEADEPVECPVCETPAALTPEHIALIRKSVEDSSGLDQALKAAERELQAAAASVRSAATRLEKQFPAFATWGTAERRRRRFRIEKLAALLGADFDAELSEWTSKARALVRARHELKRKERSTLADLEPEGLKELDADGLEQLRASIQVTESLHEFARTALKEYLTATESLLGPLKAAVEDASAVAGWGDFARRTQDLEGTVASVRDFAAHAVLEKELRKACKDIDRAKQGVLDDKFEGLQSDVMAWWDLLRPGEPSFFSKMGLRPGAGRNIDFKAGLAKSAERHDPKFRDAVAVFSQSQLVCLGLATFLARAAVPGSFVVLDDPMTAVDDDFSTYFIHHVLRRLIDKGVQVIVTTHSERLREHARSLYVEGELESFDLVLDAHDKGTLATKNQSVLSVMLKKAGFYTKSSDLESRKEGAERIRDCAELFCKELIVRRRREAGEAYASTTDYSGKQGDLGNLVPICRPHLTGADELGKLNSIATLMAPGNHNDAPPAKAALATCHGNLNRLNAKYLR